MSERDFPKEKNTLWLRIKELDKAAEGRAMTPEEKTNFEAAHVDFQAIVEQEARATSVGTLAGYMARTSKPEQTAAIRSGASDNQGASVEVRTAIARMHDRANQGKLTEDEVDKFYSDHTEYKETREAFRDWLRDGTISGRNVRALQADADTAGGFTVPLQIFQNEVIQAVHDNVYLYGRSRNFTVDRAESLGAPVLQTPLALPTWGTELSVGTADTAMNFGKRELRPHPLVGEILVSKKLLRQSGIDVEGLVRDQIAYKIGVRLEQALLNGLGVFQPLGLFSTDASNPVTTGTDITAASSFTISSTAADDLIALKFNLKQQYWGSAVAVVNRLHGVQIRQMKDANGQFIFTPGFSAGLQSNDGFDRILNMPILMSEYAPVSTGVGSAPTCNQITAITGNSTNVALTGYVAAMFDPSFIWTAQALSLNIQHLTELKAESNQDAFIFRMEVDGMPVLGEAFARYRLLGR